MCGIVGYNITEKNALEMVLTSLQNLEYRGYDSAGVSYVNNNKIITKKTVGRVSSLQEICQKDEMTSTAIAHTRWATHGAAVAVNAHPHHVGKIALIHNGIIENYAEIKEDLQLKGCEFVSQTDTEVASQFISYHIQTKTIDEIIQIFLQTFTGKYAIAFLIEGDDTIYIVRSKGSPIVVGYLHNGHAVASDFNALAPHTNQFSIIGDHEYAKLKQNEIIFFNKNGEKVDKKPKDYNIKQTTLAKDGFETFMMKEIYEQPDVVKNLTNNYINGEKIEFPNFLGLQNFKKIVAIACGTSFYACLLGKSLMEKYANIPVTVSISSEFHASKQFWEDDTLYIFASQSGETADTISAMEFVIANKAMSSKILSILNYAHSSMSQKSDFVIQCFAGVEVGVASTKNFIAQAVIFYLLSAQNNKNSTQEIISEIRQLPQIIENLLQNNTFYEKIKNVADKIIASKKVVYTGRTMLYPIACEGALKLSELSYLIVQPIPSGEFKHGPIAIVDNTSTIISLTHSENLYSKTISSNEEIRARNGNVIEISDNTNATISITDAKNLPHTYPILITIAVQLISYHTAHKLGNDIDKPRNLAKSVTVE